MLRIEPVPAFNDNYLWLWHWSGQSRAAVVDPGDAAPIREYLQRNELELGAILLTHHHADHVGGVAALAKQWSVPVYGPRSPRLPQVTHAVADGESILVEGIGFQVIAVPGHTLEHVAYFAESAEGSPLVFCGDTLFAAGCGRMFEGSPPQMWASLQRLASLPGETRVYCTHEYTLSNLKFARNVLGDQPALIARTALEIAKREAGKPTLPSSIALELETNPFLRTQDPVVAAKLQEAGYWAGGEPSQVFGALRAWKDRF